MREASRVMDNLLIRLSDSSINISNLLAYHIKSTGLGPRWRSIKLRGWGQ